MLNSAKAGCGTVAADGAAGARAGENAVTANMERRPIADMLAAGGRAPPRTFSPPAATRGKGGSTEEETAN